MSVIWTPHATEAWVPGSVVSSGDTQTVVRIRVDGKDIQVTLPGPVQRFDLVADGSLDQVCDNLVDLESYSEGIILHHIRTRFEKGNIYTFVGDILVAVNPYKHLDIYSTRIMEDVYTSIRRNDLRLRPHVFTIAAMSLARMKSDQKNQCVLISGESGAGKTETTKKILQFISQMSHSSSSRGSISVENQILDSNPILEAFGNAKTIRNNNSSRFGKYMEINFDKKFCIKGCNITSYLLEKTRVVRVTQNERNYHIFYMLVAGANVEQRKEFYLKNVEQFDYLTQGECATIERRNDEDEFQDLLQAMNNLGFDSKFQHDIFQALAGILHLGNLEFTSRSDDGSVISSSMDCRNISKYLGFPDPAMLEKTLCYRENIVNKEVFMIPLNPLKAKDQLDALAKYIYGRVFDVIVSYVNSSLFRGKVGNSIGILDIFGFEVFKDNSFEQLCINYCNERLQTFFNEIIFEGEMRMYVADGVNCDDISFQDNMECVKLIDLKGAGIFSVLDEQVILPGGSDDKFIQKLNQIFDENNSTKSMYYVRNRRKPKEFGVKHFAGDVLYNVESFLEKNKDALATGLVKLINQSSIGFIHTPDAEAERNASTASMPASPTARNATRITLSAKFKLDLDNLMTTLRATTPYFIRCIKPNEYQLADSFDSPLTLGQLKYSGLFEAVSIRKAGYAVRMPHKLFIDRYKYCIDPRLPDELIHTDPRTYCQALFEQIYPRLQNIAPPLVGSRPGPPPLKGVGPPRAPPPPPRPSMTSGSNRVLQAWCVGNTRVYIRSQELKIQLDNYRYLKAGAFMAVRIQCIVRGFLVRLITNKLLGVSREQKLREKKRAEQERADMAKEDKLSLENEILFRNDLELQKRLLEAKKAKIKAENERKMKIAIASALVLQRHVRGMIGRTRGRRFICEKAYERALESQAHDALLHAINLQRKYKVTSKLLKSYQYHSKALILNIFNESHVITQLEEAIAATNIELLNAAIDLTVKNNMMYLPVYQVALETLEQCHRRRQVLDLLHQEMVFNTSTIPKLINRVDIIQKLIHDAISLGLAATEPIVYDSAIRITKIESLLKIRQDMRRAVELCSLKRMEATLKEREKLCRIYGDDLFTEEHIAIIGMQRMFRYDKQISDDYRVDTILSKTSLDIQASSSSTLSWRCEMDEDDSEEGKFDVEDDDDVKLPPFVKEILDFIHFSTNLEVPIESKQKIYRRLFKWVLAQAVWKYVKPTDELSANDIAKLNARNTFTGSGSLSPSKLNDMDTQQLSSINQSPIKPTPINIGKGWSFGASSSPSRTDLDKSRVIRKTMKPNKNTNTSTLKGNMLNDSLKAREAKTTAKTSKTSTVSGKSKTVKDVFSSLNELLAERGLGSESSPGPSPLRKTGTGKAPSPMRSQGYDDARSLMSGDARSMMSDMNGTAIPFAMRASKSEVAAHEALKKGRKMMSSSGMHRADRKIDEALVEYDKFFGKHRVDPGRWK